MGTDYEITLGAVTVGGGFEIRSGFVTFDGVSELVGVEFSIPLPGHELIVTEDVISNPDGSDTITIWIEGQDPGGPFPTPGASLFANPILLFPNPLFSNLKVIVDDLHWGSFPGETNESVIVSELEVLLTFSGDVEVPTDPIGVDITGTGTFEDPLGLVINFDPLDFSDTMLGDATDLHFSFTVTHIPEPASIALLGIGALALFAFACRRRLTS